MMRLVSAIQARRDHEDGNRWLSSGKYGILYFITITSRIPSSLKLSETNLGSTGPGKLKEIEKRPGGHNSWTFTSNTTDGPFGTPLPITAPSTFTLPSSRIPHFISPAITKSHYLIISIFFFINIFYSSASFSTSCICEFPKMFVLTLQPIT